MLLPEVDQPIRQSRLHPGEYRFSFDRLYEVVSTISLAQHVETSTLTHHFCCRDQIGARSKQESKIKILRCLCIAIRTG
jgi:hypothetical protein